MTHRDEPPTCETPGYAYPGVPCAFADEFSRTMREFPRDMRKGRSQGHNTVTYARKGRYSNQPPDKVVSDM